MRRIAIATAALFLTAGGAFAKEPSPAAKVAVDANAPKPAAQPAPTKADASVDLTLDGLDQVGRNLREFSAKLESTETNVDLGDFSKSAGRIWYQKRGDDNARIHVIFDSKQAGNRTYHDKIE